MFVKTRALETISNLRKRIRFVSGGTSSSKTISIIMWIIDYCQCHKGKTVSVVSESFPHLKRGAMRDFQNIMISQRYWDDERWNKTDSIYDFGDGTILEFFSADQPGKVRGPRRNVLFLNEANNLAYEVYTQLEIRTKEIIWVDSNPTHEYWMYTEVMKNNDIDFVTLTYRDNDALDKSIVDSIESRKNNKNWYAVYGLGQLGEVEGKIYKDWQIIDEIPHEAKLERYGLDFGYSNDPTAIVAVYRYNGGFILDEITYQKGLSNKQIADILMNNELRLVIADSAEPKSIDEIMSYGVSIQPSNKGQGSVLQGIQWVQEQRISVTKRSINVIKEYRNYMWQTNKDGAIINEPEAGWDHVCFSAGTMVNGKKIEDIGYETGIKDVYEFLIAGEKLISTKNHRIITNRGVVDIDTLRYNDTIWKKTLLFTKVSGGLDIQTVRDGLLGLTTVAVKRILEARGRDYIDLFGKKKMGLSPMDTIYTTLTAIPLIIQLITLSLLTATNTLLHIGVNTSVNYGGQKLLKLLRLLLSGLKLKRAKEKEKRWGIKTLILCLISQKLKRVVTFVERNTKQNLTVTIDSATSTVVRKRYVGLEPVYNLKTKSGMYHANGILVSNCDAVRYALESLKPVDMTYRPINNKKWGIR